MIELKLEDIIRAKKEEFSKGVINNKNLWNKFKFWERENHKDLEVPNFEEVPKNIYLREEDIPNPIIVMRCINYDYFENGRY